MNEIPELPCPPEIHPPQIPPKPFFYWVKKFLACNPMYLGSAALLLLGIYKLSIEPAFLHGEIAQLGFNLGALQIYELLLAGTALWLASRKIMYDAGLLVGLENLLVLVPFILISQAALISKPAVWLLCIGAGAIATARFTGLKRFLPALNLPNRVLGLGLCILLVNVTLPIVYRLLHEHKIGTHVYSGAAYETNEFAWALLLPLLCAAVNVLPKPVNIGPSGLERRWVSLGCMSLWLAATGVHLYCLGYVYDFPLRAELLAPVLCILCWTIRNRIGDVLPEVPELLRRWLLLPPLLAGLTAVNPHGSSYFLQVSILNAALYGAVCMHDRKNRLALQLMWLSLVCIVAAWPADWMFGTSSGLTRGNSIGIALLGYIGCSIGLTRNPKIAIAGAFLIWTLTFTAFEEIKGVEHWAFQCALVFILVHSLRWNDQEHAGARAIRIVMSLAWVMHSWCWNGSGGSRLAIAMFGSVILLAWLAHRVINHSNRPVEIAIAAILVLISTPGLTIGQKAGSLPFGFLLIAGSFLLFGLGTVLALTRHHWHRTDS